MEGGRGAQALHTAVEKYPLCRMSVNERQAHLTNPTEIRSTARWFNRWRLGDRLSKGSGSPGTFILIVSRRDGPVRSFPRPHVQALRPDFRQLMPTWGRYRWEEPSGLPLFTCPGWEHFGALFSYCRRSANLPTQAVGEWEGGWKLSCSRSGFPLGGFARRRERHQAITGLSPFLARLSRNGAQGTSRRAR